MSELWGYQDIALRTRMSKQAVWKRKDELPHPDFWAGGRPLWRPESVRAWIEGASRRGSEGSN